MKRSMSRVANKIYLFFKNLPYGLKARDERTCKKQTSSFSKYNSYFEKILKILKNFLFENDYLLSSSSM